MVKQKCCCGAEIEIQFHSEYMNEITNRKLFEELREWNSRHSFCTRERIEGAIDELKDDIINEEEVLTLG